MILATITTEGLSLYMLVVGVLLHVIGLGWLIAKGMRRYKIFRSKGDEQ